VSADGSYAIEGRAALRAPAGEVVRWLVRPELIGRWMPGVERVEPLTGGEPAVGARTRVVVSGGVYAGWTFVGEIAELEADRLVRVWELDGARAGALPIEAGADALRRTVTWALAPAGGGGTELTCSVVTAIPGLGASAARLGGRAEERALRAALDRLRAEADGERRGLLARLRGGGQPIAPL
jgi:uncharacterized protein YndB with AHSA1/START domain